MSNKMQVVINISEEVYKDIMLHNREMREGGKSAYYFEGLIKNGTPIPDNTTNGDIIKKLFPNTTIEERYLIDVLEEANLYRVHGLDGVTDFTAEWWNAPYNAESEDRE